MDVIKDWDRPDAATAGFIVPPGDGDDVPSKPGPKRKAERGTTGGRFLVDEAVLGPGEHPPGVDPTVADLAAWEELGRLAGIERA